MSIPLARVGSLLQRQRSFIAVVGLVVGCSGEPAGPATTISQPISALATNEAAIDQASDLVLEDVLQRIVPGLDARTAGALRGPLTAIMAVLKNQETSALAGAIAVARAALAEPMAANDERLPDLAAIALALDAVDPE